MTLSDAPHVWSKFSMQSPTRQDFWLLLGCIGCVVGISVGFGCCYCSKPTSVDSQSSIPAICLYIIGYLLVALPSIWYLFVRTYIWVVLCYVKCLLLILVLVTGKEYLIREYNNISEEKPILSLFVAYIVAACFEEMIKIVCYLAPLGVAKDLRTVYDLLFLSVISGCSFATVENLLLAKSGVAVAWSRFLWCTLTHTSDCLVGTLILAYMKFGLLRDRWYLYPLVLIVPLLLHGTYDYVLFLSKDLQLAWVGYLSIGVGTFSVILAVVLFYPLRRSARTFKECFHPPRVVKVLV